MENSTHLTQPLDRTIFAVFKKELTKKIQAWCLENPGKSINKYEVVEIAFPGMVTSLSNKAIIKEGFRATGTYPWDPSQVSFSRMAASSVFASEEQIRPVDTDDGQLQVNHGTRPSPAPTLRYHEDLRRRNFPKLPCRRHLTYK